MKLTIVASILPFAFCAVAAEADGPYSFIAASSNAAFDGKWLFPAVTQTSFRHDLATLSSDRFLDFWISVDGQLEYNSTVNGRSVLRAARVNGVTKLEPNLAGISFEQNLVTSEKTFSVRDGINLTIRGGEKWYACNEKDGSVTVKVLVAGEEPAQKGACSEVTFEAVDGFA